MKLKAAITDGAPAQLFEAFGSREFAEGFLVDVVGAIFGADDATKRPAEYYLQFPDRTVQVNPGVYGVEVRLTGVSRGTREPKIFHEGLRALNRLVVNTTQRALIAAGDRDPATDLRVQIFVVMMIDGDVPGTPQSGFYGSVLESEPIWVTASDPIGLD